MRNSVLKPHARGEGVLVGKLTGSQEAYSVQGTWSFAEEVSVLIFHGDFQITAY